MRRPGRAAPEATGTRQAGFTLLEMLVVVLVVGLLMGLLTSAVQFGTRAVARGARLSDSIEATDTTERVLRQLIAAVRPGERGAPSFQTDAHGLSFVAAVPAALAGLPGIVPATDAVIRLNLAASRLTLVLTPRFADASVGGAMPQSRLLDHVSRLVASFHDAGGWHDVWTQPGVPDLIRLRISFSDGRHWPDIVVTPRIGPAAA